MPFGSSRRARFAVMNQPLLFAAAPVCYSTVLPVARTWGYSTLGYSTLGYGGYGYSSLLI